MGTEVWRAFDTDLERPAIIKLCLESDTPAEHRLATQLEALQRLHSISGVATLLAHGRGKKGLWLALELVEGRSLAECLPMPEERALRLAFDILGTLHEMALRGVSHGDLQPRNVVVTPSGFPVLLDVSPGGEVATPLYVAPEVAAGAKPDPASDMYSLGMLLDTMIAAPSTALGVVLDRLRQSQPQRRFADFQSLAQALELGYPRRPELPPFVGRQEEQSLLQRLARATVQGAGPWVAIAGESGMGKTRLLEEFAATSGFRVLQGASTAAALTRGHGVLQQALACLERGAQVELVSSDDLLSWSAFEAEMLVSVFPGLGRLFPRVAPKDMAGPLHVEILAKALADLLVSLARQGRPLLLILDDLQWCQPETLKLLIMLSQRDLAGCLVCLAYRSDEWELPEELRCPHRLQLAPLRTAEVEQFLRASRVEVTAGGVEAARRWSQGNPFFLGEFLRGGEVSDKATVALRQRLNSLPAESQHMLSAAALIGKSFPRALMARLWGEEQLQPWLEEAHRERIIWLGPDQATFVHDRLREEALAMLGPEDRHRLQRRLADDYLTHSQDVEAQAYHVYQAGDRGRAYELCRQAARQARSQNRFPQARAFLEMALELRDDDDIRWDLYQVFRCLGEFARAHQQLLLLLERTEPGVERALVHRELARVLVDRAQEDARLHTGACMRELGLAQELTLGSAAATLSRLLRRSWRTQPERSKEALLRIVQTAMDHVFNTQPGLFALMLAEAVPLAWESEDPSGLIILADVYVLLQFLGLDGRAQQLRARLERILATLEDPITEARMRIRMTFRGLLGRTAKEDYGSALRCLPPLELSGDRFDLVRAYLTCGLLALGLGRVAEVAALARRMLQMDSQTPHESWLSMGCHFALLVEPSLVTAPVAQRLRAFELGPYDLENLHIGIARALMAERSGEFDDALHYFARLPKTKHPYGFVQVHVAWARTLRLAAESLPRLHQERRQQLLEQGWEKLQLCLKGSQRFPLYGAWALREKALLQLARGQEEEARRSLAAALAYAREWQQGWQECQTHEEWGRVGRLCGWEEAAEHERRGLQMAEEMGAGSLLPNPRTNYPPLASCSGLAREVLEGAAPALPRCHAQDWIEFWRRLGQIGRERPHQQAQVSGLRQEWETAQDRSWRLFHCSGLALALTDDQGRLGAWNQSFERLLGARLGQTLEEVAQPFQGSLWRSRRGEVFRVHRRAPYLVCAPVTTARVEQLMEQQLQILEERWQLLERLDMPAPLREDVRPLASPARLLAHFRRRGLELQQQGGPLPWSRLQARARWALLAVLREGCNNIFKHVPDRRGRLEWTEEEGFLTMRLVNAYRQGHTSSSGTRFGLPSLEWRVRQARGQLAVARSAADSWELLLRLPIQPPEPT